MEKNNADNKIEIKCPKCGYNLKYIDIIYKETVYDRFEVDLNNKTLTIDFGDKITSDILRYECRECETELPEEIVNILQDFEQQ